MKKAFIVPLLCLLLLGYADAEKWIGVNDVRYSSHKDYTRLVIDLSGPVEFTSHRLSNPARLYFDLRNSALTKKIHTIPINDNILSSVRVAQFDKDTVRVVLDLRSDVRFYTFILNEPRHRLVIDVYSEGIRVIKKGGYGAIKRVVIDPGHGGEDPGAIGPSGLMEKDVVLDIAMKLGKRLKEDYDIDVLYTRTTDVFIPLNERTEFANSRDADIFISIHANASPNRDRKGVETYILNWTDDKEAMRVAARENAISFKKMQNAHNELQLILLDLARNNKRDESIRLAHHIQKSIISGLKDANNWVDDLGVKQALFYVLIGAEMPSVLAEVSFISNPIEERMLAKDSHRDMIANSIANGVGEYIKQSTLTVLR
ncbi:MAG: N-acetylmuramoyl-L-alanine amidase [Thermodesulfovibrionia bacterium]